MSSRPPSRHRRSSTQRRLAFISPREFDWLVVAVLLAWALPNVPWRWNLPSHSGTAREIIGYFVAALAMAAPFLWRRRFPISVAGLEVGLLALRVGLGRNVVASMAAVVVACYGIGAYSSLRRRALPMACLAFAAAVVLVLSGYEQRRTGLACVLVGAALLAGDAASARRAEQASAIEAAKLTERTRLARELHDVLAHQLSAIAVQAGGARLAAQATASAPNPAEVTLSTIEVLSREALAELSQLLGVLRHEVGDTPAMQPSPTLNDLDKLLDSVRGTGIPVVAAIKGDITRVGAGVGLCTYRIIQESLTNVARHAPGASTAVSINVTDDCVDVSIINEPPLNDHARRTIWSASGGLGILGMRERTEAFGGRFAAGPTRVGGFAVAARHLRNDRPVAVVKDAVDGR